MPAGFTRNVSDYASGPSRVRSVGKSFVKRRCEMSFNDIATHAASKFGWKAKAAAIVLLIATFAWSMISIGIATVSGPWSLETLIIVIMLNAAEMVGAGWLLTPVNAAPDADAVRSKIKKGIQIIWGLSVGSAYIAEFSIVWLGTWEKFQNMPVGFSWQTCRFILTIAVCVITVFGTDFSLNLLMASTLPKTENHTFGMQTGRVEPV